MPMNELLPKCSLVAVHDTKKTGLKFVHINLKKFEGKFLIILFMDRFITDVEIAEWKEFNSHESKFKEVNASVIGVATASHPSIRHWMMNRMNGIKFPVIADFSGEFSGALGVLDRQTNCAVRAQAVISPQQKMIHLSVNNEFHVSQPNNIIQFIKRVSHMFQVTEASEEKASAVQNQEKENQISSDETKETAKQSQTNSNQEASAASNMKEERTATEMNDQTETKDVNENLEGATEKHEDSVEKDETSESTEKQEKSETKQKDVKSEPVQKQVQIVETRKEDSQSRGSQWSSSRDSRSTNSSSSERSSISSKSFNSKGSSKSTKSSKSKQSNKVSIS